MTKAVVRTDDLDGFLPRAKNAARKANQGKAFDGKVTPAFEDPWRQHPLQ